MPYSRRRGEVNVRIAMPNPNPAISPSTTKGHGESPVKNQYREADERAQGGHCGGGDEQFLEDRVHELHSLLIDSLLPPALSTKLGGSEIIPYERT